MFKAGKLGGGLKYVLFSSLFGVIIQFDVIIFQSGRNHQAEKKLKP